MFIPDWVFSKLIQSLVVFTYNRIFVPFAIRSLTSLVQKVQVDSFNICRNKVLESFKSRAFNG